MIGQGISMLVQADAGVAAIATAGGGFYRELPKGQSLDTAPSWTYFFVSTKPNHALQTVSELVMRRLQIDCYGGPPTGAQAITLAAAINNVLNGFRGNLPDPDSTYVDRCAWSDEMDAEFDSASRTWRKILEYEVWYMQTANKL